MSAEEAAFSLDEPVSGTRLVTIDRADRGDVVPSKAEGPRMLVLSDAGSTRGYEILGPGHVGIVTFRCFVDACEAFREARENGELSSGCIVSCPDRIVLMHTGRRADFVSRSRSATIRKQWNERAPRASVGPKRPDWMDDRSKLPMKPPGRP